MSLSTVWKLDRLVFPATSFSVITSARWQANIQQMVERPAGHPHPMFAANQSQKPALEFSTTELDVLLGAINFGGASFGTIDSYFKKAAVTGSVARATAEHQRVRIAASCGYLTRIRLVHNGRSEGTAVLQANYDGTNDPFAYTGSVALAGNLSAGTYFGAGPVSINGTSLGGVQEISIDSGVRLIQAGGESEEFDTFVGLEMTEPTVTITFLQAINWATVGLRGTTLDGTNGLVFYGRKFSQGGSRVANATAQHIKFTGLNGIATPVDSNGQQSSPITDTVRVQLTSVSDSVLPLTVNTASAIS